MPARRRALAGAFSRIQATINIQQVLIGSVDIGIRHLEAKVFGKPHLVPDLDRIITLLVSHIRKNIPLLNRNGNPIIKLRFELFVARTAVVAEVRIQRNLGAAMVTNFQKCITALAAVNVIRADFGTASRTYRYTQTLLIYTTNYTLFN